MPGNIDDILNEMSMGSAQPAAGTAPAPTDTAPSPKAPQQAAPSASGIDDILNEMPTIDELTGEQLPPGLDGKSPQSAINKSPLSALDRFKMSMGNEAGNVEYLKKQFDAVQPILDKEGKPTSDLAVMKNGKWYRADANNGDIRDPWEMAKSYIKDPGEFVKDIADLGPMSIAAGLAAAPLAAIAGGVGTATAGALGAGATVAAGIGAATSAGVVGAGTAGIRTSLGRIVGTYDATPQEQLWDVSFETLLNAGTAGVIEAGVKPTAKYVANKIPDLAEKFADTKLGGAVVNTPKAIFKKLFAGMSVGEDNFDIAVEHPYKLQSLMKATHDATGGNIDAYHNSLTDSQIGQMKDVAQNARNTLTEIYGKMKDRLLQSVPESFSTNYDDAIQSSYAGAIEKGIGKLIVQKGENEVTLTGAEAAKHLAENGLRGARFELLSQKEMANAIHAGAALKDEMGYLSVDGQAYDAVKGFFDDMTRFANSAKSSGKQAAENLLTFKKLASDRAMAIANMEKVRDIPNVRYLVNQARTSIDNAIHGGLKEAGVGSAFTEMNGTYNQLAEKFAPLLNANYRFEKTGDPKIYEGLLTQFLSRPGKNVTNKFAVDAAIDAAEENGLGSLAKQLANSKLRIQLGEAAKAFNPLKPTGSTVKAGAAGMTTYALLTGNAPLAAAIGTGAALRSPMMAKTGVALAQTAFKGQQMLASMPKFQLAKFLDSPQATAAFVNTILQAPGIRTGVQDQLQSLMQGQANPQQGQGQ